MVPEKENWIRMEKDIFIQLGQQVKVEVGLSINYNVDIRISSFRGYVLVPWAKHTEHFV